MSFSVARVCMSSSPASLTRHGVITYTGKRSVYVVPNNRPFLKWRDPQFIDAIPPFEPQDPKKPLGYPWNLIGANVVTRLPIVSRDITPFERQSDEFLRRMADLKSKMSRDEVLRMDHINEYKDHLRKIETDILAGKRIGRGEFLPIKKQQQVLDSEKTYKAFKIAPRSSLADKQDDRRSLDRCYQEHLYLLVKRRRYNHQYPWQFLHSYRSGDQTMRDASNDALDTHTVRLESWTPSNAPQGYASYRYPEPRPDGTVGAKVFFYLSFLISGDRFAYDQERYLDYAWVTKQQLPEYLYGDYLTTAMEITSYREG